MKEKEKFLIVKEMLKSYCDILKLIKSYEIDLFFYISLIGYHNNENLLYLIYRTNIEILSNLSDEMDSIIDKFKYMQEKL